MGENVEEKKEEPKKIKKRTNWEEENEGKTRK
jgi:hypothetical protein